MISSGKLSLYFESCKSESVNYKKKICRFISYIPNFMFIMRHNESNQNWMGVNGGSNKWDIGTQ